MRINRRERKYFNKLKKACEDLKKNHFPVDKVASELKKGKFIPKSSYDVVNLEKQTKPWIYGVSEHFKKLTSIPNYTQMLMFKLSDKLPNQKFLPFNKFNELLDCAHEVNRYYDEDIQSGIDIQQAMLSGVKIVFKQAYQATSGLYGEMKHKLYAAQILTDFVLQELTAAGLKGNPFTEYAKGYVLENAEEMITEIQTDIENEGYDKETVLQAFDDALMEWVPSDSRFNVSINMNELGENEVNERSPMNQYNPQEKSVRFITD
jgi:hypothetical protein